MPPAPKTVLLCCGTRTAQPKPCSDTQPSCDVCLSAEMDGAYHHRGRPDGPPLGSGDGKRTRPASRRARRIRGCDSQYCWRSRRDGGESQDFTVRLWDAATGKELHRWEQSHGTVTGAAFGVNEDVVLTWGVDALARLWNPHRSYDSATLGEGCAGFGAVAQGYLSEDERRIVTILRNGRTDVWSRNGTLIFTLHTFPETRSLSGCGFSYRPLPKPLLLPLRRIWATCWFTAQTVRLSYSICQARTR